MAYSTGTASTFAALLTALQNACTANGWTLSGDVLHKGTCYAEVKLGTLGETGAPANKMIFVRAGNGIDGSNNLTDPMTSGTYPVGTGPGLGVIRALQYTANYPDWDWPVTYHAHVLTSPDEVYFLVSYGGGTKWQYLCFGQSPAPGNPGTGNWAAATVPESLAVSFFRGEDYLGAVINAYGGNGYYGNRFIVGPFWFMSRGGNSAGDGCLGSQMHGATEWTDGSAGWSSKTHSALEATVGTAYGANRTVGGSGITNNLVARTPNAWNNETLLAPIIIVSPRAEFKTSIVGHLKHLRMCRNDFLADGELITLGPDKWKVYPCFKKNATYRTAGDAGFSIPANMGHSGTLAMAIRYDGP